MYPYENLDSVCEWYFKVKGSRKGINPFINAAKEVGSKTNSGAYIFKDEQALFRVFQRFLGEELKAKKINSFGELLQYVC